jgi:RNA polymerase sigma-70 factor (ECF subfamily)
MTADAADEELMLAYGRGDAAAFDALYARHRGGLYRFLLRGLSNRATAEEVYQEVWSRVIAARQRYRPEAKFSTWLYQIAHNLLVDQYRRKAPEQDGADIEVALAQFADDDGRQPERELSSFEERRRLQQAIGALPDEQRIALQLRLEQELSLEEIGRITGAGRETVKSRLRYAMDKLRERLDP